MQGRMMSLVIITAVALDHFFQVLSGVFLDMNLTGLFVTAGITSLLSQTSDRS
ncbi:MAG: hypothetical protein HC785_28170 [Calothrix sp. CSU_2_0]|nr:hypothetical protein [Calothrix sp. CSU_2_0]